MRRRALLVGFSAALLCTVSISAQTLGAVLTGSQEVPPTTSPGFGNATVTFDSTRQNITVTITVANLGAPIIAAHIHKKDVGSQTGGVFIGFDASMFAGGKLTQTVPVTPDQANQLLQNPSNFYVNVHTTQFGGGAIRGDLAIVSGTVQTFVADLRGANEVPANSSTAFGVARLTFDTVNNTITFEVNSSGIASPTAAHIHTGAAGVSMGVLIGFATAPTAFTGGRIKGQLTLTGTDITNMNNIIANPSGFYFNVHSAAFPGGEIRGQLVSANELDVAVAGHVPGIGGTFVTDARVFNPSFDTPVAVLVEFLPGGGAANTNASASMVVNIPARGTAVLDDVAGFFGLNVTGIGALRITSASQVVATSRISQGQGSPTGTFGQFVPALQPTFCLHCNAALRRGVMPQLSSRPGVAAGFRTNCGFFNPNPATVTVRTELRDSTGTVVGSNLITLQPLSQQQSAIGVFFPGVDLSNALNLTLSFDASAAVLGYCSVLDNTSQDSILVKAHEDVGVSANQ